MKTLLSLICILVSASAFAGTYSFADAVTIDRGGVVITIKVRFNTGDLDEQGQPIYQTENWGRNKGEGLAAFKARVKAAVIEYLAARNQVLTEADATSDIQ